MRRIFIVVLLLTGGIMLGCDKEIKEAVRPARVPVAPGQWRLPDSGDISFPNHSERA